MKKALFLLIVGALISGVAAYAASANPAFEAVRTH
jgi:hypothetical protein